MFNMMKWFLRGLVDEHVQLSDAERWRVHQRMKKLAATDRWANLRAIAPGAAAMILIPFWISVQKTWNHAWSIVFELVFAFIVVTYVYWIWRRFYARYARQAIRDLGFADICPRCGYDLTGLSPGKNACPECGAPRLPFKPSTE